MYLGSGPNRTISHITEQSGIIDLYWSCHENIKDNFEINQHTVHHAAADMEADIIDLAKGLKIVRTETGTSHKVGKVTDQLVQGYGILQSSLKSGSLSTDIDTEDDPELVVNDYTDLVI